MKIKVINGPNLHMTGKRRPEVYGFETLDDINAYLKKIAESYGAEISFFQSNSESEIIDAVWDCRGKYDGIIINAGAFTHYSYAIRDAIEGAEVPAIEVHMSNIAAREEFRHTSVLTPVCRGAVLGFGKKSYALALKYFTDGDIS